MNLLQAAVPPDQLREIVRKRGIDFQIRPETEKELREAGAAPELIEALRKLAPSPPKSEPPPPPEVPAATDQALLLIEGAPTGTEIYIDDEFKGQVSRDGRLKIQALSPEKHVLRVSVEGYKDKVETLEFAAGETRTHTPKLTPKPPAAPPTPKPLVAGAGVSLYYESSGERAKLTFEVHTGDSPVLYVDVNGNGRIDQGDTAYGLTSDERACTQYLLALGKTTLCGTFHSRGALEVKTEGDSTRYIWTIPKSELSRDGKFVQFVVGVYLGASKKWASYPSEPFVNPVRIPLQ